AQNCLVHHPRIVPLPIGLENRRLHWHGVIGDYWALRRRPRPKSRLGRILFGFAVGNNPAARGPAEAGLNDLPSAERCPPLNSRAYRRRLAEYGFVASPPGNGEDCHRSWEALYLRVVPIVKRSAATEYFRSLGLPFLIIDRWEELRDYSE